MSAQAKPTPGPWFLGGIHGVSPCGGGAMRGIQSEHGLIGYAVFRPTLRGDAYRDANAHLMADAPALRQQRDELADALEALLVAAYETPIEELRAWAYRHLAFAGSKRAAARAAFDVLRKAGRP